MRLVAALPTVLLALSGCEGSPESHALPGALSAAMVAPQIEFQTLSVDENSPVDTLVGTVVATDGDPGAVLTYTIIDGNASGLFVLDPDNGEIRVALANLNHEATPAYALTVQVTDDDALSASNDVLILVDNVDESPTIEDQTVPVAEDLQGGATAGYVVAINPDQGDPITYTLLSSDDPGIFGLESGNGRIYVIDSNELDYEQTTTYTMQVRVSDVANHADEATVTLAVQDINEPPSLENQVFQVEEGAAVDTVVGVLVVDDVDIDDVHTFTILSGDPSGAFTVGTDGALTVADASAIDHETTPSFSLQVQVEDQGGLTDEATITVQVSNVYEPAVVEDDEAEGVEDEILIVDVLANDFDPDGEFINIIAVEYPTPSGGDTRVERQGTPEPDDDVIVYTPAADWFGTESFIYSASDGTNVFQATVTVTITPTNDPPTANDDLLTANEDEETILDVLANDSDEPDDGETLELLEVTAPTSGASAVIDGGTIVYTPAPDFVGVDFFSYTMGDGTPGSTDEADVTVEVLNTNDPPVLLVGDGTLNYATSYAQGSAPVALTHPALTLSDPDGGTLDRVEVTLIGRADPQELMYGNAAGTMLAVNYDALTDQIVIDGTGTMTDFRAVLRSLIYDNLANPITPGERQLTFRASDGEAWSETATVYLDVVGSLDTGDADTDTDTDTDKDGGACAGCVTGSDASGAALLLGALALTRRRRLIQRT